MAAVAEFQPQFNQNYSTDSQFLHIVEQPDTSALDTPGAIAQLQELEEQGKKENIYSFYSITNERNFLKKMSNLSEEEKKEYVHFDMVRFLNEFVGKVPYTKLLYKTQDDHLSFLGQDSLKIYKQTAEMTPKGSREWDDFEGFSKINSMFTSNNTDTPEFATWASAPKIAAYGFYFLWHRLDESTIHEYVLRYDEKMGETTNTKKIMQTIHPDIDFSNFNNTSDYLRNPIFSRSENSQKFIDNTFNAVGITLESIQASHLFEKIIELKLEEDLAEFKDEMLYFASNEFSPAQTQLHENKLKVMLATIYNKARDVKKQIEDPTYVGRRNDEFNEFISKNQLHNVDRKEAERLFYSQQDTSVDILSDCIITRGGLSAMAEFYNVLTKGLPKDMLDKEQTEKGICSACGQTKDIGPCGLCTDCEKSA